MKFESQDSRRFFYLLLLAAGTTAYFLLSPYLATIVFSLVTVTMFMPVYNRILKWFKGREALSTAAVILVIFLLILGPLALVVNLTVTQAAEIQRDVTGLLAGKTDGLDLDIALEYVNGMINKLPFLTEEMVITADQVRAWIQDILNPIFSFLADWALQLGSSGAELMIKMVIFIAILAVMFSRYGRFLQLVKDLSPLDDDLDQHYIDRITVMTKSMVLGVFIIAIVQGLMTGILFWITGVKYVAFLTLISIFLSILPAGSQILAVPVGIGLLLMGNIWQGVVLIAGSLLGVGSIDNILRPFLVSRESELNIALLLLSVFGGVNLFGFLGIIYGPVVMIFLVTTIEIYLDHFRTVQSS
ncbi:MAG: AI-2E family transporter [Calditrichaeota bacterium]|nr:AI-2E family transporter [Calditrichota bacterium]HQU73272.1 AI-2E family transporter [Calditrichia bacterium]